MAKQTMKQAVYCARHDTYSNPECLPCVREERDALHQLALELGEFISTVAPDAPWWLEELAPRLDKLLAAHPTDETGQGEG